MLRARPSHKVRLLLVLAALVASSLSPGALGHANARPANGSAGSSSVEPLLTWHLDMDVSAPPATLAATADSATAQLESVLAAKLSAASISRAVEPANVDGQPGYRVTLQGQTDDAGLRQMLYGALSPEFDVLGGPMEVSVTGQAHTGQTLTVTLESRPGTGYGWDLAPDNTASVTAGDFTLSQRGQALGGPAITTAVLKSAADTNATARLVYRRPWETQAAITRHLSVQAAAWPDSLDLTSPIPPPSNLAVASGIQDGPPLTASGNLPSAWDWRPRLTPIRDQGTCGSCWAFGTVGVMESAISIFSGVSTDLSEQFLVSCNQSGWSCNGGWWAHDYHTTALGKSQTTVGAVLESDMPYQGVDGTCTAAIANHPYRLSSWHWVFSGGSIPSVAQIKTAIYTYGPVGASVCVGTAFQHYDYTKNNGIFSTTETAANCHPTNHAIVLVGWNDSGSYWILRNSWGPGWGQNGYMYIKWATSQVGYAANYVIFTPTNLNNHVYVPFVKQ